MTVVEDGSALAQIDSLLAAHPFGNSEYITGQLHDRYERRLDKIATRVPAAMELLGALKRTESHPRHRVIGDMVVRCAINHALRQVETGEPHVLPLDECEGILRATARQLAVGTYGPLGAGLHDRLGADPSYHGWIWNENRPDDIFKQAFEKLVIDNYGERPCTLNADEVAMVQKGVRLLERLLPLASRSALSHTHLLAIFDPAGSWTTRSSSSEIRLSGTIFLSRKLVSNPWWVAEYVFHEALHQQLYDFRQGHSLLDPNFDRVDAPTICSLWNVPDATRNNYWDVHRALAAFHVYVHLSLLALLAERHAEDLANEYGTQRGPFRMTRSRTARSRAHYLSEGIRTSLWDELGPAGRKLVEWYDEVLAALDPAPPPPGSYVHLLLDRYGREAREVEMFLQEDTPDSEISAQLMTLAQQEIEAARTALAAMKKDSDLSPLNEAQAQVFVKTQTDASPEESAATRYARVRSLVTRAVIKASEDGYTLAESRVPDEILKQAVDSSSEQISTLLGR